MRIRGQLSRARANRQATTDGSVSSFSARDDDDKITHCFLLRERDRSVVARKPESGRAAAIEIECARDFEPVRQVR
jgi:hypothetical protein